MKNTVLPLLLLLIAPIAVFSQTIDIPRQGFSIQLTKGWEQTEVLENNRPISVLEAVRSEERGDFMTVLVQPTKDPVPAKDRVKTWGAEMAEALDIVKYKCTLKNINGVSWYVFEGKMQDESQVVLYNTVQHYQGYGFTFVSIKQYKGLAKEAKTMMQTVKFSRPGSFDEIGRAFQQFHTDDRTQLKAPQGYRFDTKVQEKETPAYVASTYRSLFKNKSTDAVLVIDNYFLLPFAINVVTDREAMDTLSMGLASRVAARQFEQSQIPYEEISIGPWPKAPVQVYLFQFRLNRPEGPTIHFIYYVNRGTRLDILKVQMPNGMERDFLPSIERWVLANLE